MRQFLHIPKTGGSSIASLLDSSTEYWAHWKATLIPAEELPNVWAVIRNPYDRAVSMYHHVQKRKQHQQTFKQFWLDNPYHPVSRVGELELPMAEYLCDVDGNVLVPTLVEFTEIASHMLKEYGKEIPHLNRSEREDYKSYYDDESFELITNRYKQDLAVFNYEW